MKKVDPEFIKVIRNAKKNEKLVFFLGAGVSMAQGYPDWNGYVRHLIEYWKYNLASINDGESDQVGWVKKLDWLEQQENITNARKIDILHYLIEENSTAKIKDTDKDYLLQYEQEWFEKAVPVTKNNSILHSLVSLNGSYITTNYDLEIEKSVAGFGYDEINSLEKAKVGRFAVGNGPYVIHLHGTPKAGFESFINSAADYSNLYYKQSSSHYEGVNEFIRGKVIVFIGSSLQEDEILSNLDLKEAHAYALMKGYGDDLSNQMIEDYYKNKKNIEIIWYGDTYDELPTYLSRVVDEVIVQYRRNSRMEEGILE